MWMMEDDKEAPTAGVQQESKEPDEIEEDTDEAGRGL
jgi:hypothetical protein